MPQRYGDDETQLIDLRQFLSVVRRRKWTVIITTAIVVALSAFMVYHRTPVYTASSRVEVRPLTNDASQYGGGYYELLSSMDTEAERVSSSQVAAEAKGLGAPPGSTVSVIVPANTTVLDISCTQPSPELAGDCANAYAKGYVEDRIQQATAAASANAAPLLQAINDANSTISRLVDRRVGESDPRLAAARSELATARAQLPLLPTANQTPAVVARSATLPQGPANKGYVSEGILALLVGLGLGVALAFVRERLDERVTDRDHFEAALGAPILAIVPRVPGWRNRGDARLVSISAPDSAVSESYRTARTTLLYLAREGGLNVIAITGPGQGEGKTTTTGNLAVSLAQIGKRVVMISADLRRPRLHKFFGLRNGMGLADVLVGRTDVPSALLKTQVPGLLLMTSGHTPENPAELLASGAMDELIEELGKVADYVLLDTAPALVVADALGLAPKVHGVIVVADAQRSHRSSLEFMTAQLERTGGLVIGGILNNLDPSDSKKYGSYGKYYRTYYQGADRYKVSDDQQRDLSDTGAPTHNGNGVKGTGSNGNANGHRRKTRKLIGGKRNSTTEGDTGSESWS